MRKTEIKVSVTLDEANIPDTIVWKSDDDKTNQEHVSKAMMLALFEKDTMETVKIDLWTKDMQMQEMDRFFFQTLKSMADTYFKATKNNVLASRMQEFARYFAEETKIIDK